MSVTTVPVNVIGAEVSEKSPYAFGRKAVAWKCDGCGCGEGCSDACVWNCSCSCHDGWKMVQDGGRFRAQISSSAAGIDLRSGGGMADIVDNH